MAESHVSLQSLTPLDLKQLSRQQKRQLLQRHREGKTRNASVVLLLGTDLLASGTSGIGAPELASIYEQILIAALDCGSLGAARHYLTLLQKRFGRQSVRVRHLEGLCLEADGKTVEAQRHYKAILKDSPTDNFPVQRLCAMLKSEGKYEAAIALLEKQRVYTDEENETHTFFDIHRGDALASYRELSNLYYLTNNTRMSLHYAEEAMLFSGQSYLAHTRLGELCYMTGDLPRALIEYSQSLRLNDHPNNSRAAHGLWVTADDIVRRVKAGGRRSDTEQEEREKAVALRTWAEKKLLEMYKGSPMLSAVEAMLQRGA